MHTTPLADMEPGAEAKSLVGEVLSDRYRILELIGEGGMGVVYKAEHVHMHKLLAVKVLHHELTAVEEVVQRFEREAQAAGRIEHPNVCAATDFGRAKSGAFFLVMEYLEGQELSDVLDEEGSLALPRALRITEQICAALARAHDMGIVHRDLKPENVLLVERDGVPDIVKVLDFGIARVPPSSEDAPHQTLTRAGFVMGTPAYLSPEQGSGGAVDHRADLYSLGVVLFEMVAGRRPFTSSSTVELIGMHVTRPPPSLSKLSAANRVPRRLEQLVQKMLAKEAHERPQSAAEIRDELREIAKRLEAGTTADDISQKAGQVARRAADGLKNVSEKVSPVLKDAADAAPAVVPTLRTLPLRIWPIVAAFLVICALGLIATWSFIFGGEPDEAPTPGGTPVTPPVFGGAPQPAGEAAPPNTAAPASLAAARARPDVAAVLAKRAALGPEEAARELEAIYRRDKSPELAYLLAELEATAGENWSALQHAKAALRGNRALAADKGMRGFVLGELRGRNAGMASKIIEAYYMPQVIGELEGLACSEEIQKGRRRAQAILAKRAAPKQLSSYCKLVMDLERGRNCSAKRAAVVAMTELGDRRVLPTLRRLGTTKGQRTVFSRRRRGCDLSKELTKAVETLEARP